MELTSVSSIGQKASFDDVFSNKLKDINNILTAIEGNQIETEHIQDNFHETLKKINELQEFVNDSKVFLPSYNMKKCSNEIKELTKYYENLHDKILPKKKFAFGKRTTKPLKPKVEVNVEPVRELLVYKDDCGFKNRSNEVLKLEEDQTFSKDIVLEKLDNCKVCIYGIPSTVHMSSLKNCKIFAFASTSIFVDDCKNTILTCASQQLRVHDTKLCDFYIYVVSTAIIENCKDLRFGPLLLNSPTIEKCFESTAFDRNKNNWKLINDFDWLSSYEPSPNWTEISENDRNQPSVEEE
ncbi:tubulin-specific chaperone C-like [Adelges cooleyi]|uniref:tubulin-specific chaperone C-like n=1 Tax=Adelges cooleyi TaxID=133065 RepID=UPI00217F82EA|nr:tubulin-specific chaperone C-like [Adelges cooleyi]